MSPDSATPLPRILPARVVLALRFLLGLTLGAFLHYLLYRVGLPVEPFIYVAF